MWAPFLKLQRYAAGTYASWRVSIVADASTPRSKYTPIAGISGWIRSSNGGVFSI